MHFANIFGRVRISMLDAGQRDSRSLGQLHNSFQVHFEEEAVMQFWS